MRSVPAAYRGSQSLTVVDHLLQIPRALALIP
jgi:hypothetical protein